MQIFTCFFKHNYIYIYIIIVYYIYIIVQHVFIYGSKPPLGHQTTKISQWPHLRCAKIIYLTNLWSPISFKSPQPCLSFTALGNRQHQSLPPHLQTSLPALRVFLPTQEGQVLLKHLSLPYHPVNQLLLFFQGVPKEGECNVADRCCPQLVCCLINVNFKAIHALKLLCIPCPNKMKYSKLTYFFSWASRRTTRSNDAIITNSSL